MSLCNSNLSGVQIPTRTRALSLFQNVHTGSGAHPAPYSMVPGFFSGVQWPVHDVYTSLPLPCSAEFKNKWIYSSTPPLCLQGTDREFLGHSDVN